MFENPFALWSAGGTATWGYFAFSIGGEVRRGIHERVPLVKNNLYLELITVPLGMAPVCLIPGALTSASSLIDGRLDAQEHLGIGVVAYLASLGGFLGGYYTAKLK